MGAGFTFAVDDVEVLTSELGRRSLGELYPNALQLEPAAGELVVPPSSHGLLDAVGLAFSQHRPLVLTPDAIWITITQGFARHVGLHPERLRSRFVRHAGRKRLVVVHPESTLPSDFAPAIAGLSEKLEEELGPGIARLLTCDFSTTTPLERTASRVVLLSTFQHYFDYVVECVCGIPRITVTGTPADWRTMIERLPVLAEFELAWWTQGLSPILEHFVRAASGAPDVAFWKRIYKPRQAYAGNLVTGWIGRLFPYLRGRGEFDRKNPLLATEEYRAGPRSDLLAAGFTDDEVPNGFSEAPLTVLCNDTPPLPLDLVAGFLGTAELEQGALVPRLGWFVRPGKPTPALIAASLREEGLTSVPAREKFREGVPAAICVLYADHDGGTLFQADGRPWRLRPLEEHQTVSVVQTVAFGAQHRAQFTLFCDLPNGNLLAYWERERRWLILELPAASVEGDSAPFKITCGLEQIRVVALSIEQLFDTAIATRGAPPGERAPQPTRTLAELLTGRGLWIKFD